MVNKVRQAFLDAGLVEPAIRLSLCSPPKSSGRWAVAGASGDLPPVVLLTDSR
jgi:hypothetical protein